MPKLPAIGASTGQTHKEPPSLSTTAAVSRQLTDPSTVRKAGIEALKPRVSGAVQRRGDMPLPADASKLQINLNGLVASPEMAVVKHHPIDDLAELYPGRGLDKFHQRGALAVAARKLVISKHVLIVTSFGVGENPETGAPLIETDGLIGAAHLGLCLGRLGSIVSFACSKEAEPNLRATLKAMDRDLEKYSRIIMMDSGRDPEAINKAAEIINALGIDAIMYSEVSGPIKDADGSYDNYDQRNMFGLSIVEWNAPLWAFGEAAKRGVPPVWTGTTADGGNEYGTKNLTNIPVALNGQPMQSTTDAHVVTAITSNLAATIVAGFAARLAGQNRLMPKAEHEVNAIEAAMQSGAVDGVTRSKVPNAIVDLKELGTRSSAVDGYSVEWNQAMVRAANMFIETFTRPDVQIQEKLTQRHKAGLSSRILITPMDSSHGAFAMFPDVSKYLGYKYGIQIATLYLVDHGNAPYGPKTPEEIATLVSNIIGAAIKLQSQMFSFICNTANSQKDAAFSEAQINQVREAFKSDFFAGIKHAVKRMTGKNMKGDDFLAPLVQPTAAAIVERGRTNVVVLSTEAMAMSGQYPELIKKGAQAAGKTIHVQAIGCDKAWAEAVNEMKHLSTDQADQDEVKEAIRHELEKIDFTGRKDMEIVLCCTHYPQLMRQIRKLLDAKGHTDVKLVDPAETVADSIAKKMSATDFGVPLLPKGMELALHSHVLTSADDDNLLAVTDAARLFIGPDTTVQQVSQNWKGIDLDTVKPHVYVPRSKAHGNVGDESAALPKVVRQTSLPGVGDPKQAVASKKKMRKSPLPFWNGNDGLRNTDAAKALKKLLAIFPEKFRSRLNEQTSLQPPQASGAAAADALSEVAKGKQPASERVSE